METKPNDEHIVPILLFLQDGIGLDQSTKWNRQWTKRYRLIEIASSISNVHT